MGFNRRPPLEPGQDSKVYILTDHEHDIFAVLFWCTREEHHQPVVRRSKPSTVNYTHILKLLYGDEKRTLTMLNRIKKKVLVSNSTSYDTFKGSPTLQGTCIASEVLQTAMQNELKHDVVGLRLFQKLQPLFDADIDNGSFEMVHDLLKFQKYNNKPRAIDTESPGHISTRSGLMYSSVVAGNKVMSNTDTVDVCDPSQDPGSAKCATLLPEARSLMTAGVREEVVVGSISRTETVIKNPLRLRSPTTVFQYDDLPRSPSATVESAPSSVVTALEPEGNETRPDFGYDGSNLEAQNTCADTKFNILEPAEDPVDTKLKEFRGAYKSVECVKTTIKKLERKQLEAATMTAKLKRKRDSIGNDLEKWNARKEIIDKELGDRKNDFERLKNTLTSITMALQDAVRPITSKNSTDGKEPI